MYYLYKLYLKGTPKYYVGVTSNPKQREMAHKSAINISIQDIKAGTRLTRKDYRITIAKHILATERWKSRQFAEFHVAFEVIFEVGETIEEAKAAETRYLSRRGKHCLNKTAKSHYRGARVDYSARYAYICDQMSKGLL